MSAPRQKIYEGKSKIIFTSNNPEFVIQYFKDDITAFNNNKKDIISGKGIINNYISSSIMHKLNNINIKTHFIKLLNSREQLVKKVTIIPLEVVLRNISCGSFCQRFSLNEGIKFPSPVIEFFYKDDLLSDPLITENDILHNNIASSFILEKIKSISLKINNSLKDIFDKAKINLVDFKLEFGKTNVNNDNTLILADEISPDTCRLWCKETNEKLDKDRYRQNLGNVFEGYKKIAQKLSINLPEL